MQIYTPLDETSEGDRHPPPRAPRLFHRRIREAEGDHRKNDQGRTPPQGLMRVGQLNRATPREYPPRTPHFRGGVVSLSARRRAVSTGSA